MNSLMRSRHPSLPHWSSYEQPKAHPQKALLIAGAVVVGLGVLSWVYLGADVKRYMKIHSM